MGVESINNNTPPILNSLNDCTSNEMSRPSNCVNRPKNKVRNQAIIVNIIIHINSRSVLLIIKLTRDTGIVKIFFIVFSIYSRLKIQVVTTPYEGAHMMRTVYKLTVYEISLKGVDGSFTYVPTTTTRGATA